MEKKFTNIKNSVLYCHQIKIVFEKKKQHLLDFEVNTQTSFTFSTKIRRKTKRFLERCPKSVWRILQKTAQKKNSTQFTRKVCS